MMLITNLCPEQRKLQYLQALLLDIRPYPAPTGAHGHDS